MAHAKLPMREVVHERPRGIRDTDRDEKDPLHEVRPGILDERFDRAGDTVQALAHRNGCSRSRAGSGYQATLEDEGPTPSDTGLAVEVRLGEDRRGGSSSIPVISASELQARVVGGSAHGAEREVRVVLPDHL